MKKIHKLNVNAVDTGVQLDIDGSPEGINIEYEILPQVIAAVIEEISIFQTATPHMPAAKLLEARLGLEEARRRAQKGKASVVAATNALPNTAMASHRHWVAQESRRLRDLGVGEPSTQTNHISGTPSEQGKEDLSEPPSGQSPHPTRHLERFFQLVRSVIRDRHGNISRPG